MNRVRSIAALALFIPVFLVCFSQKGSACETSGSSARDGCADTAEPQACFVDAAGREVTFSRLPARIVVVGRGPFMVLHLLYMFPEAASRLVGMEERSKLSAFICLVDPAFSRKTILKPYPGPEHIASLKPDVVLMKGSIMDQTGTSLERMGIKVVYVGMEEPQQFFKDVDNLGLLLGNRARAQEIKSYYQSRLSLIHNRLKDVSEQEKPGLLVLGYSIRGNRGAVQVPAASWIQTLQASAAGTKPVWLDTVFRVSDGWTIVNFEQIALWNPDIITVIVPHSLKPEQLMSTLAKDPQWRLLKAVQEGRFHAFPSDLYGWDSPEPRWILGMIWTAITAWPGRFADIDMKTEVMNYFITLYGMDRSRVEKELFPACPLFAGD